MKNKLFAIALVLLMIGSTVPGVVAQVPPTPDPQPPQDPGDEVPNTPQPPPAPVDPEQAPGEIALDEAFVPVERFPCPAASFTPDQLSGETTWGNGSHHAASDACVAQWGSGSYQRGSEAVLRSPGLPTSHLVASSQPSDTINTATRTLIEQGLTPDTVATIVGSLASGCPDLSGLATGGTDTPFYHAVTNSRDACRKLIRGASVFTELPEDPAGLGGLFLEAHHAFQFSTPDQNQRASDGGWVEIRTPDSGWKRLDPVAIYGPSRVGNKVLCAVTGPPMAQTNQLLTGTFIPVLTQDVGDTTDQVNRLWNEGPPGLPGGSSDFFIPRELTGTASPIETVPDSAAEWEEQCLGTLRSMYGEDTQFSQDVEAAGEQAQADAPPRSSDRARPYPGTIRGHGPGFVGSTEDDDGDLQFVDHWFDLTPYAGETVEIRFHATGGPGLGTQDGGWWVDDVNVRYAGPPRDLSVRLDHPNDGDSLPEGKTSVAATVQNLGRTPSEPGRVELTVGNATANATFPALEPLEEHKVTTVLPLPEADSARVTAQLQRVASSQGRQVSAAHVDAYQPNNNASAVVRIGDVERISLDVTDVRQEEADVNVTVEVTNGGNKPISVPLHANLTPVDLNTRLPRLNERTDLGQVASIMVPHGRQANSLGVLEPSRDANATVTLPDKGVFRLTVTSPADPTAEAVAFLTLDEAAPTAFETTLGTTNPGPTLDVPRDGFEIVGPDTGTQEDQAFQALLQNPIGGPETRHVPRGPYALGAFGEELPEDYSPARTDTPFRDAAQIDFRQDCEIRGADLGSFLNPWLQAGCSATGVDLTGPADNLDSGVTLPEEVRTPASLQMWNIRQHHVTIYGVGTKAEGSDNQERLNTISGEDQHATELAAAQLRPPEDSGDRVKLEFRHAADVNWTGRLGSKARVIVMPKGGLNLSAQLEAVESEVDNATKQLPPAAQQVARSTLLNVFFDTLVDSVKGTLEANDAHRYPQAACSPAQGINAPGLSNLREICGESQVLDSVEPTCAQVLLTCEFTDHVSSTLIRSGEETTPAKVIEFTRPDGWRNVTIDVTDIVENTTTRVNEHGFYVLFDLETTTDLESVIATADARGSEEGTNAEVQVGGNDQSTDLSNNEVRFGWADGERPLWTVDDPQLYRLRGDERQITWTLCDGPEVNPCVSDDRGFGPIDTRGWRPYSSDNPDAKSSTWRFEALGGDPSSLDPGALVWEGNATQRLEINGQAITVTDRHDPRPYSVLRSPEIQLSGFSQPTAKMHVKLGQVDNGLLGDQNNPLETPIVQRCNNMEQAESGTVWTQTGWNLRARVVHENGTLGPARTVQPLGGYHDCSEAGDVPVRFNGSAKFRTARALQTRAASNPIPSGGHTCLESGPGETRVDPLLLCGDTNLAFGHGQPLFGLPMPWQDVRFDLSPFEGEQIVLEVHAFGLTNEDGIGRGELTVDDLSVSEGNPPIDLSVSHDKQRFIPPGSEERFELNVTNAGAEAVEQVAIRRTVTGADGCQVVDPVTVIRSLFDPETGSAGLPPSGSVSIQDGQLDWTAPNRENELFQRQLVVTPRSSISLSERPQIILQHATGSGMINATTLDPDDCARDLTVHSEILEGQAEIDRDDQTFTVQQRVVRSQTSGETSQRTAVKVQAVDDHSVESLPAYLAPPPKAGDRLERAGIVDIQVLQSSPGSAVKIEARPENPDLITTTIVLASPDGLLLEKGSEEVTIRNLPEGRYMGYVTFGGSEYEILEFTIRESPEGGSDARPGDNTVTLRGETKAIPRLSIREIAVPSFVNVSEEVTFPIRIENTGNVPLENVSATVKVKPFGFTRTAEQVPLLAPGDVANADVTLAIPDARPVRLRVDATSDSGVSDSTGTGLLAFAKTPVTAEAGNHEHWTTGDEIQFGDGERVPADVNASLPLTGEMDLARSPLSALFLNHSGSLEEAYDGVSLEWTGDDETLTHPIKTKLTSSHAGGEAGERTPAYTGELNAVRANASDLPGARASLVDEIEPQEWRSTGGFEMEVDPAFRTSFWLPTAPLLGAEASTSQVSNELRIPLTFGEWCRLTKEMVPERTPLRIRVLERRMFTEPSSTTRGWDATVRLKTGAFPSGETEAKIVDAHPVVPVSDDEQTGWTIVTYEVPLAPLIPAVESLAEPFKIFGGHDVDGDGTDDHIHSSSDACDLLRTHEKSWATSAFPDQTRTSLAERLSNAQFVFELRADQSTGTSEGGLDVGWFISEVTVPSLIDDGQTDTDFPGVDLRVTASETAGDPDLAKGCDKIRQQESFDPRAVGGCTEVEGGGTPQIGEMEPGGARNLANTDSHVQIVRFRGDSATKAYANTRIDSLTALLSNRTMELRNTDDDEADELISPGGSIGREPLAGPFRYVDAVALVDLRSGTRGNLLVDVEGSGSHSIAQVVAAPIDPGTRSSEAAPARVDWRPLPLVTDNDFDGTQEPDELQLGIEEAFREGTGTNIGQNLCEQQNLDAGPPQTPLGATENAIVQVEQNATTKLADVDRICADLSPVAGEFALVGVRFWLPTANSFAEIHDASAWMIVPEPTKLQPRLRGLTDDTVNEGTYTLNDAALLSMTPPFSHSVDVDVAGTQPVDLGSSVEDVLVENGFPDLTINVTEPGLESRWRMDVFVNVTWEDEDRIEHEAHGSVPLSEDTFVGSQTIEIPWEDVRRALADRDHEQGATVDGEIHEADHFDTWLADSPVLPANVTEFEVTVETTTERLVEAQPGCPTDLDELATSSDLQCRLLADLVQSDDSVDRALPTEGGLDQDPGVAGLEILPARALPGTPRTAEVEIVNPSSSPREVTGNLSIIDTNGERLSRTPVPETIVRPWDNATLRIPLRIPADEPTRVRVVADVGDERVVDDYRTTLDHESRGLLQENFFVTRTGVMATPDASIPPLPGERDDGIGYRFETTGGVNNAYALGTNVIDLGPDTSLFSDATEQNLIDLLRDEDTAPILTFQHQRNLRDEDEGDFAYLFVSACRFEDGECVDDTVLGGWAPERSSARSAHVIETGGTQTGDSQPQDVCTQSGTQSSSEEATQYGISSIAGGGTGQQIFRGSTTSGALQPDNLDEWTSVAVPLRPVLDKYEDDPAWNDGTDIRFNIVIGECDADAPSSMIVDNVEIGSARPVLTLAAQDVPIRPGAEKRYRFTLENQGSGSDEFHVVPKATLPEDWQVSVELLDGSKLYDSTTGALTPIHLREGQTTEALLRLEVPGTEPGGVSGAVPMTAYATDAPGIRSSGALNASIHTGDADGLGGDFQDPGRMTVQTSREDQPDFRVDAASVNVKDAEVGRQAKIQFKIVNEGRGGAKDVPIRVGVTGPSGFTELKGPDGEVVREDFTPGARKFLTYTWNPTKPGPHRLRVIADPGQQAIDLLVGEKLGAFSGLVQETQECDPARTCENVLDHTIDVDPLQQPELSVTVDDVPDRISVGSSTQLEIIVRNNGGRTARDAELTLSENGLLPILDTLTVDLPPIEPGNVTVLRPDWEPVTPGEILVLASVSAPGEFTGQRADGSSAGSDNDAAIPVLVDRARTSVTLSSQIQTEPGRGHVVSATVANDGTSVLRVLPETVRKGGILLSPVIPQPLEVSPGEQREVPLLGFALLGTSPHTATLPFPVDKGEALVDVTVVRAPDARVVLDQRPIKPGTIEIDARVVNEGNVPLSGTVNVVGQGIQGSAEIEVPVGATENVTIETRIAPGTSAGLREIATIVRDGDATIRGQHRLEILEAPAVGFEITTEDRSLAGSAEGELVVQNIGNRPLDGRLTVDGPASLTGSRLVDLDPGQRATYPITWLSSANRTGTATVITTGGETIGQTQLIPEEEGTELKLLRVSTRPSVNLRAGMEIQVVGTAENTGDAPVRNATLGVTVDGELMQTFQLDRLDAGEATVVSQAIELPDAGTLTIGLVDIAAFQRGEDAGPATTIEVAEASFGIGTIAEVPAIPWPGMIILLAAVALGVKRR